MPSYYEILEIDEHAGEQEIQAAYDRIAGECYARLRDPKTHDESIERIKQITQAKNTLLDAARRKQYDEAAAAEQAQASAPPSPWRRFWARCMDILIFTVVFYPVYRYFADFVFFEDWVFTLEALGVGIVLFILLDSAVIAAARTTPGKWMLSIGIQAAGGGKPARIKLIKRNLMASLFGFGLYIPPVSIATLAIQHRNLKKQGLEALTPWDRASGTKVSYGPIQRRRLLLLLPVALLLLIDLVNAL